MLIRSTWNPWSLFDELDRSMMMGPSKQLPDIEDTEDETHLSFDVPGMTEDDIELTVTGTILSVRGERKGRRSMTFERRYDLGTTYDLDTVRAHVANGVLTISLAKSARAKPRRIKLTSGVMDKVKGLLGTSKDKAA
jgi:HSP20 family molecular chaperone IbpA